MAKECARRSVRFILIGDVPSPVDFYIEGCEFYSIAGQRRLPFQLARRLPLRHYSRKNIGYLLAMATKAPWILETDDDNEPLERFWDPKPESGRFACVREAGWVNMYRYFTDALVWPRGFPLQAVRPSCVEAPPEPMVDDALCPIQQGLANANPDVDAIYRLVLPLPIEYREGSVALSPGSWCPFNSQSTVFFRRAFPLLYLPSFCSFRMTDIWRSFVALRICGENGWSVLFHGPTAVQERNEHDLLADFEQEIVGYLQNDRIVETLAALSLRAGEESIPENLYLCYDALVRLGVVPKKELDLVEAWNRDLGEIRRRDRREWREAIAG
jgi:hypothetical protein